MAVLGRGRFLLGAAGVEGGAKRRERERKDDEPFALHAPTHWAIVADPTFLLGG